MATTADAIHNTEGKARRKLGWLVVVILVVVAAGTAIAFGANDKNPSKEKAGYVYSQPSFAMFIQWTESGTKVDGNLYVSFLNTSVSDHVQTQSMSFAGSISGGNVTLALGGTLFGSTSMSGQIGGTNLTLDAPNGNGKIIQIAFSPGSITEYNSAVSVLQRQSRAALEAAAKKQAAEAAVAKAQAAAAAAAAARQQAIDNTAESTCEALDTGYGTDGGSLFCLNVPYVGSDGSTYYAEATLNPQTGLLQGPLNTAGTSASMQQCSSYFGTWNSILQICLPY